MGAYGPSTRTVLEVRHAVQRAFGDESGVQLEDADLFMWINDAQDEIVNRNKILKGTSTTASVVGQQDYTIDPSVLVHQIEAIHYGGALLSNISFVEAENRVISSNSSLSQGGEPSMWWEWAGKFSLWPIPATVQPIVFYYTKRPVRITQTTDLLSVPDKYYQSLVRYVLQQAYEMDEDWQASQVKGQQFDAAISDMGEEERTAQNMTYATVQVIE